VERREEKERRRVEGFFMALPAAALGWSGGGASSRLGGLEMLMCGSLGGLGDLFIYICGASML